MYMQEDVSICTKESSLVYAAGRLVGDSGERISEGLGVIRMGKGEMRQDK